LGFYWHEAVAIEGNRDMGPYTALPGRVLAFTGSQLWKASEDVLSDAFPEPGVMAGRVAQIATEPRWGHLAAINEAMAGAVHAYFGRRGAMWAPVPLTTRMISSPGAVYGREAISYTTDTNPITLDWFGQEAYLAESSQIYLELMLSNPDVREVWCLYNSFRKEAADPTHLSEFHHVEWEGAGTGQPANIAVVLGLLEEIVGAVLGTGRHIEYFLEPAELRALERVVRGAVALTLEESLELLQRDTDNGQYGFHTLKHFGQWEEVRLTELVGGRLVILGEFPLLEVPFYHRPMERGGRRVADAADFIWPGYREVVGSGARIGDVAELEEKAAVFDLPRADYEPYLRSRQLPGYRPSAGFGLGWERLVQGMLRLPHIWEATQFPRGHVGLVP
jgi:asparaginyl-tRNA synthetase